MFVNDQKAAERFVSNQLAAFDISAALFDDGAKVALAEESLGVPRQLRNFARLAVFLARLEGVPRVVAAHVRTAAQISAGTDLDDDDAGTLLPAPLADNMPPIASFQEPHQASPGTPTARRALLPAQDIARRVRPPLSRPRPARSQQVSWIIGIALILAAFMTGIHAENPGPQLAALMNAMLTSAGQRAPNLPASVGSCASIP